MLWRSECIVYRVTESRDLGERGCISRLPGKCAQNVPGVLKEETH